MKMELQTARGVADVAPEEKILKNQVIADLQKIFELYGFQPLETPILERYETLAAKFAAGEASDALKETFRLTDQGKRKLGLRFDLTVPMCRFIAMNPNLRMPFKRYQIGQVFRDGPIKTGRAREFWQMDIDIAGTYSMLAEAEILSLVQNIFNQWSLPITIKVNNRKLLNGILSQLNIKNKKQVIITIDKLEKFGEKEVKKEFKQKKIDSKKVNSLLRTLKIKNLGLLKQKIKNKEGQEGIRELEELFNYLRILKVKTEFDPSLARGLGYYTGPIFEIYIKKGKITSSLAAGGRYDELVGSFAGGSKEVPATGISFGLVPIMESLKEKKGLKQKTTAKVYVIPIKAVREGLEAVEKLRAEGINCDMDLVGRGVSKNLEYASALGIPYVVFVGERELKEGKVKLRDMETGEERLLKVKEVVKKIGQ